MKVIKIPKFMILLNTGFFSNPSKENEEVFVDANNDLKNRTKKYGKENPVAIAVKIRNIYGTDS